MDKVDPANPAETVRRYTRGGAAKACCRTRPAWAKLHRKDRTNNVQHKRHRGIPCVPPRNMSICPSLDNLHDNKPEFAPNLKGVAHNRRQIQF